jgi:maleate cis-trans isomerase
MDVDSLGLQVTSLDGFKGHLDDIVKRTAELVKRHGWQGAIVGGGPVELFNPGLFQRLQEGAKVPVATALTSCVSALRSFSARRVLFMTPFDGPLNQLFKEYLAGCGVEAVLPPQVVEKYTDATKLSPEEVYALTQKALAATTSVDAVYFQGGPLDPLKILDKIESELHTTVVASNQAMLWFVLSKLGITTPIRGGGKLLGEPRMVPA